MVERGSELVLKGSVNLQALISLLGLQSERDWLDYKGQCDLSKKRDLVELTKDIGAMMMVGGYIIIGADDQGQPAGGVAHPELFDPATLHAKLAKYLPTPFEVRSAVHEHSGQSYAIIYVRSHHDGFCIFAADGKYEDAQGHTRTVFRAGDVFARHGTRSERWHQTDIELIRQRLQKQAAGQGDRRTRALELTEQIGANIQGDRPWLVLAVVPESPTPDPSMLDRDGVGRFLDDWQFARAPIEGFATSTATYRQPGRTVITNENTVKQPAGWWHLELHDTGEALAAHALAVPIASVPTGVRGWHGMPADVSEADTVPLRRDLIEIQLFTLLDVLTAHAWGVGALGDVTLVARLLAPSNGEWQALRLLDEATDSAQQHVGWRPATGRADVRPGRDALIPAVNKAWLADMEEAPARVKAARRLAADLLALFGVAEPTLLTAGGTLEPYGASTDRQQLVWQHANRVGLPHDPVSPADRQKRYEEAIAAAKADFLGR
jgi:hypothetical protein